MIRKEWRDYKWEFRPLVILPWLLLSPAGLLPLMWLLSLEWGWLDAFRWNESTASGWVQAVGSILAVASGFVLAFYQTRQAEKAARRERHIRLQDIFESKRDYRERAVYVAASAAAACEQFTNYREENRDYDPDLMGLYLGMIDKACAEMECISVAELSSSPVVDAWLSFKRYFYVFQMRSRSNLLNSFPVAGVFFRSHLNELMLSLENFNKAVLAAALPASDDTKI